MGRFVRVAVTAWLLAMLVAPTLPAQSTEGSCGPPLLAFPPAPRNYEPGGAFSIPFAVENPNGHVEVARADIRVTTPDGWSAVPARRELTLGPHAVQQNVLALTAPTRGTGAPAGNITISVTLVCITGVVQQSSLPAQHVLDVRIRSFEAPWLAVIGVFLVLTAGVTVLGIRRVRKSVLLTPTTPERAIEPGRSAKYTFTIHNRRGKPAEYDLVVGGLPPGWSIHLALDHVALEPGEEKTLWAILKAPPDAPRGEAVPFALRLQGERGPRDGAATVLMAHVAHDEA